MAVSDGNKVTVKYGCTASEEVRAFALQIAVTNGKFSVLSPQEISTDYYVYPGSIQFAVDSNGATYISDLGSPVAEQDPNGGVIEMASLYAASDPNHPNPPPTGAGPYALLSFGVDCDSGPQTVTLSLDTKRGGVVLKDPNITPTVNLPAPLVVPCTTECLVVGKNCGGVMITQAMYDRWVTLGRPNCWCYPCHYRGDINGDCLVNATDLMGTDGPGGAILDGWRDGWNFPYTALIACADINNDGLINATDLMGTDGPGGAIINGWRDGWTFGCPGGCLPGVQSCLP